MKRMIALMDFVVVIPSEARFPLGFGLASTKMSLSATRAPQASHYSLFSVSSDASILVWRSRPSQEARVGYAKLVYEALQLCSIL